MKTQEKKYFGTDGIRGLVGTELINPAFVLKLGWAVGKVLGNASSESKVIIGKDTRISGYMLESALEAGLAAAGMNIHLLGPMPTPAIAYLTRTLRADTGVVISASHNPYHDNGIKFFGNLGFKLSDELELAIEQELDQPMVVVAAARLGKAKRIGDAPGRYIEFCKSAFPNGLTLRGLKIIVDCAYGATYHIAPSVFHELGAEVIEIGVDPDGFNINSEVGATNPGALQKLVVAENADLGIAFDGDGDRVILVDHTGDIVDGDQALFIIAKHFAELKLISGGVVGTFMSNFGLEQGLAMLNIPFTRTKIGDRHVMEELQKRGWLLGGESSGHIVNLHFHTTGDGIISALQVLTAMRQTEKALHELCAEMPKLPQILVNVKVANTSFNLEHPQLQTAIDLAEKKLGARGRILIRPSGTEPVVRVMVEGEDHKEIKTVAYSLVEAVSNHCCG